LLFLSWRIAVKTLAESLITALQIRPFCDMTDVAGLSPQQFAALHVFQHEMLASYFRVCEKVPEARVNDIINRRLTQILPGGKS
jgi:hypothetical protein